MVLGIRYLFGFLSHHAGFFVRLRILPGPYAYSRDFSGKAVLHLTVPVLINICVVSKQNMQLANCQVSSLGK